MRTTRRRDTACELELRRALHALGLRYFVDRPLPCAPRRRADILFPTNRLAVFVDGCFWHGCPIHRTEPKSNRDWWRTKLDTNIARDRDTDQSLVEGGWGVVRVWEHTPVTLATEIVLGALGRAESNRRRKQDVR